MSRIIRIATLTSLYDLSKFDSKHKYNFHSFCENFYRIRFFPLNFCFFLSILCSFNLPRVNAQLERLMGSNVVHLTDRKYMTELRRRITDDFQSTLTKRINQRKVCVSNYILWLIKMKIPFGELCQSEAKISNLEKYWRQMKMFAIYKLEKS